MDIRLIILFSFLLILSITLFFILSKPKKQQPLKSPRKHKSKNVKLKSILKGAPVIDPHVPSLGYINPETSQYPNCGVIYNNPRFNVGAYVNPNWDPQPI
jgi:hypothetical protein